MLRKGEVIRNLLFWIVGIGVVSLILTGLIVYFSAVLSFLIALFIFAFFFICLSVYALLRMFWYRGLDALHERNLKTAFVRICLICFLLPCSAFFSFLLYDPLVNIGERVVTVCMLVVFSCVMIVLGLALVGKKVSIITVGVGCLIPVTLFLLLGSWLYTNLAYQPTVVDDATAVVALKEDRLLARACLGASEVLQSPYKSIYGGRNARSGQKNVCRPLPARWTKLPDGWRYLPADDIQISDGTFSFSAHSRTGNVIVCSEQDCQLVRTGGQ